MRELSPELLAFPGNPYKTVQQDKRTGSPKCDLVSKPHFLAPVHGWSKNKRMYRTLLLPNVE